MFIEDYYDDSDFIDDSLEDEEPLCYLCNVCNGSGEGLHDGSSCPLCRGSGESK